MSERTFEVNFDGLVGPTHNYAGLAYGNVASMESVLTISNPRAAVMQGLEKMRLLAGMGLVQGVLPPQERPDVKTLRQMGFSGPDSLVLEQVAKQAPHLLAACSSSSSMWAANAATVSPGADTADGKVHITLSNLTHNLHRSIECPFTGAILRTIFHDETVFAHHRALPSSLQLADEGAANHSRFCSTYGEPGIEFFVYGRQAFNAADQGPERFPARQTIEASKAVFRLHGLDAQATVFARQHPAAIDAGVFHNDVISVGNENVFFYHSMAFCDTQSVMNELKRAFRNRCGSELISLEIRPHELSIAEAVRSYLFNGQLVSLPDHGMCFIAPEECRENEKVRMLLDRIAAGPNPIERVIYVDIRQSMKNGGGPACLRLRIVLTESQQALTHQEIYLTESLYRKLTSWSLRTYRDRLHPDDLADPQLMMESRQALDELTQILSLGSIYDFQRD